MRALYVLPLVAAALACNSRTVTKYKISENSENPYVPQQVAINLRVAQEGKEIAYYVNEEKVGLDAIGQKVIEAQNEEMTFYYVNIIGSPEVQTGVIQDVKNELRKIGFLRVQYKCEPNVEVQRKLEPSEPSTFSSKNGDVYINLNSLDKLMYSKRGEGTGSKVISQNDLFGLAKRDIEENNAISFFLIADNGSSFGAYSSAVQSVYNAFKSVQEDLARQKYGKSFNELDEDKQDELRQQCAVKIFEAR